MDVVVVGSFITDFLSYCSDFPKPGETVHGHKFLKGFGGKGANQCVMTSYMDVKIAMVGRVGDDNFGKEHLDHFRELSINTDHVLVSKGVSTGVAMIQVNDKGQNCIIIVSGANLKLDEADVTAATKVIKSAKVLVTQMEINPATALQALRVAKEHGVTTILNPAPAQSKLDADMYKLADYFCPNETEAEILCGKPIKSVEDAKTALPIFLERGCSNVIITLGAMGSVYGSKKNPTPVHVPANRVEPVDSTGAGDAFIGSLAYYLVKSPELDLGEIIRRSGEIASLSVQKAGTQSSYPHKKDLSAELFK